MEKENREISRRSFIKYATAGAAGVGDLGALDGFSSNKETIKGESEKIQVSKIMTADIVVVGGGASGLCAALQAGSDGAKVILLESASSLGGNSKGTEGLFAADSAMQKEAGIKILFREIIGSEQEYFHYITNALFWKDLMTASGPNINWLAQNGVRFSGKVDNYKGLGGQIKCYHWWEGKATPYLVEPLSAKAKEVGVNIMLNTAAKDLIMSNGKVTGVYATAYDKSTIQINSGAVILATGGYVDNNKMMEERGYDMSRIMVLGFSGHNGDGLRMAIAAGGRDVSEKKCFLKEPFAKGLGFMGNINQTILNSGSCLWVNQHAERYTNENCGVVHPGNRSNAVLSQTKSFCIFDQAILDYLDKNSSTTTVAKEGLISEVDKALAENKSQNIYKADSIEELAKKVGLAPDALEATIARYNSLCQQGVDDDFNKPKANMLAISKTPYYIIRQDLAFMASIGGIAINRNMQVINKKGEPIPGLYSAGVDGCELYGDTYTINVPGSAMAHCVYSGRTAAQNALKAMKAVGEKA